MSHPLTWTRQGSWPILQPAIRGRMRCFGFTFAEPSWHPSLYTVYIQYDGNSPKSFCLCWCYHSYLKLFLYSCFVFQQWKRMQHHAILFRLYCSEHNREASSSCSAPRWPSEFVESVISYSYRTTTSRIWWKEPQKCQMVTKWLQWLLKWSITLQYYTNSLVE